MDKPILITAAVPAELALLDSQLAGEPCTIGHLPARQGTLVDREVVLAVTGLGKVNTAAALAMLVERLRPPLLVSTGCAGAYPGSGLAVGDLAVAASECYGDEGVLTPDGWYPLDLIGIPLLERGGQRFFNEFPLSRTPAEKAVQLAEALGVHLARGKFLTVSTCSGTAARGRELAGRFNAICETMEGAVAAHLAMAYAIPCLELRGVSNLVEDRDLSRWDLPGAVEQAQRFLLKLLPELDR